MRDAVAVHGVTHFGIGTRFPHAYPITFLLTLLLRPSIHSLAATCAARSLLTQGESADSKSQSGGKGRDANRQSRMERGARKRSPRCVCVHVRNSLCSCGFSLRLHHPSSSCLSSHTPTMSSRSVAERTAFCCIDLHMSEVNAAHMQIPPLRCGMTTREKWRREKRKSEALSIHL